MTVNTYLLSNYLPVIYASVQKLCSFNVYDYSYISELYSLSTIIKNKCIFEGYSPFVYRNDFAPLCTKAYVNKMKHPTGIIILI